jgi:hypothetical protein
MVLRILYWKPWGYSRSMFSWQFWRLSVMAMPGPIEATYSSNSKVNLETWRCQLDGYYRVFKILGDSRLTVSRDERAQGALGTTGTSIDDGVDIHFAGVRSGLSLNLRR